MILAASPALIRALAMILIAGGLFSVHLAAGTTASARAALAEARAAHTSALAQASTLEQVRNRAASAAEVRPSEPDLLSRLNRCMSDAGVPIAALRSHRVSAPQPIAGSPYERQTAAITLESLRPAEIAAILSRWRASEPLWTARDIRITHGGKGKADQYDAAITLETIVLSPNPPTNPSTSPTAPHTTSSSSTPAQERGR